MAEPLGTDKVLMCVGNLTIDEARYGSAPGVAAVGGDAAYAALAARLFMGEVSMLAPVGYDVPITLLTELRNVGIHATDLPVRNRATVRNVIDYHEDGSRTWRMLSTEEDFDVLSVYPPDVPTAALGVDGMMLSAMSLNSQAQLTPWLRKNSGATLYLDVQEDYLVGNRAVLQEMVAACDVFLPSEIEAVELAGTNDLVAAARTFCSWGAHTVVIKRAEQGSLVLDHGVVTEVPTARIDAVDSTGAGDAFCGAFAAVHLMTGDALTAARAGSTAARSAIADFGIAGLMVAADEVHRFGRTLSTTTEGIAR